MKIGALTQAYNEAFNLSIWIAYYGRLFGPENLYVIDHGSDDGSTEGLAPVNVIRLPRTPFDDTRKTTALTAFHLGLLQHFDCVVITDCDECVAPDPAKHRDLAAYIESVRPAAMTALGVQIHHQLDIEPPIDLTRPLLAQRRLGYFSLAGSKPVIASTPTRWRPGQHVCAPRPGVDPDLFLFHLKFIDYGAAVRRQAINVATDWSEAQRENGHGMHHRYGGERFFNEGFLDPIGVRRAGHVQPFDLSVEARAMEEGMTERGGFFFPGEVASKFVEIPDRFAEAL